MGFPSHMMLFMVIIIPVCGAKCTGGFFYESCPKGLNCYNECEGQATAPICSSKRAGWFSEGKCRIPVEETCSSSSKCAPGAFCELPVGKNTSGRCISCPKTLSQPVICVRQATWEAYERWNVLQRRSGFKLSPQKLLQVNNTVIFYHQQGTVPVAGIRYESMKAAVQSVANGIVSIGAKSSNSGALFKVTDDARFMIKGFSRECEYGELVWFLNEFALGPSGTTLNIPALAFPAFDSTYWTVMPNSETLSRAQLGGNTIQKTTVFDVKPFPLNSSDRVPFFEQLRNTRFQFPSDEKMASFRLALKEDLSTLNNRTLVDYSWLVQAFTMEPTFQMPMVKASSGPWCFQSIASPPNTSGLPVGVNWNKYVVCFSLIDYTLPFKGLQMDLGSTSLANDWSEYDNKFRSLTRCIFSLNPAPHRIGKELGLLSVRMGRLSQPRGSRGNGISLLIRVSVMYIKKDTSSRSECFEYRKAACDSLVSSYDSILEGVRPTSLIKKTCTISLHFPGFMQGWKDWIQMQASYCLGYFAEICK